MKKLFFIGMLVNVMLWPVLGMSQQWQDYVQKMGNGQVNWTTGVLQATGIGAPPEKYYGKPQARPLAMRAAKLDALRNMLEVLNGVRIDSNTLVKDAVVESDVIMSKVQGMIQGAQEVKKEYLSDGTVEVTMQMTLRGGFAQLVLPEEIKQVETIKPVLPGPPDNTPSTSSTSSGQVYTGLIVDARGIAVRPAMAPKILDENNQEVYGSAYVSREYAVQQGMSGYSKDLDAAQTNDRVTDNPLVVKGIGVKGPGNSDITISNADAARIKSVSEHLSFLKKCRVMIVVD